jgi:hypothetical protein
MCIEVFAVAAEAGKVSARRLSAISGLVVTKKNRPVKDALHFSRKPGCSCSLLSDTADWGRDTWALEPEVVEGLAAALSAIHEEAGGLSFQALWIGDKVATEECVPLKELLRDVRANKVKNRHVYRAGTRAG